MFNDRTLPYHRWEVLRTSNILFVVSFIFLFFIGCIEEGPIDLTNPYVQPSVIGTYPRDNTVGPFNLFTKDVAYSPKPHFIVQFNKLMYIFSIKSKTVTVQGFDQPTVAFPYQNFYPTAEDYNHPYNNIIAFHIHDSARTIGKLLYSVGRNYRVVIDSTVEDVNGNRLQRSYQFSFTPEPYFRVVSVYPKNGSIDVSTMSFVGIVFNSPVDSSIFSSLQLIPQQHGRWEFYFNNSNVISFRQDEPLRSGTTFTIKVQKNAYDIYKNQIYDEYISTFTTTIFRATDTNPKNGLTNVDLSTIISIHFNTDIDNSSVKEAFTINPFLEGRLIPLGNGFKFRPLNGLTPTTDYTITVSTALRTRDSTSLREPYILAFTTEPFRITRTIPQDGSTNFYRTGTLYIYFNTIIDTGSVRNAFSINPPASLIFGIAEGVGYFQFRPETTFDAYTLYTITISTEMRSKSGHHISSPYKFTFSTTD